MKLPHISLCFLFITFAYVASGFSSCYLKAGSKTDFGASTVILGCNSTAETLSDLSAICNDNQPGAYLSGKEKR